MLQFKTAINFRTKEEYNIIKKFAEQQGIDTRYFREREKGRAYICPEGYSDYNDASHIELHVNPDEICRCDEDDDFEWTYLEAADVFRNLIIAERRKNAT